MVNLQYPQLDNMTNQDQYRPLGLDLGNGFVKLKSENTETVIPSLFKQVDTSTEYEYLASSRGGVVEFLDSDRGELQNTRWLVGNPAYQEFPDSCDRIVDDRRNKITYALQGLCGALAVSIPAKSMNIALCASIHDAEVFGDALKSALNGTHTVKINGRTTTLNIKTLVVDEGLGAIAHGIKRGASTKDGQSILLDIGHGTAIISAFSGAKIIRASRYIHPNGVGKLIQAIADHPKTREFRGGISGDAQLICQGIENDFYYGRTGFNFREIYQECLMPWVREVLSPTLKKVDPWLNSCDRILATGGGVNLPGMSSVLAKKQIAVIPDAQLANVSGLFTIAQQKLGV